MGEALPYYSEINGVLVKDGSAMFLILTNHRHESQSDASFAENVTHFAGLSSAASLVVLSAARPKYMRTAAAIAVQWSMKGSETPKDLAVTMSMSREPT
ncbi:hypothetical protein NM208_g10222 [Fusarium decemcellulare]|uniref:Uncharacterized protein n=1 Tax=Fusarium decemcellulare TaxID=57161 RepID=A0ACC1RYV0_9HYPO|nr:hypothetical protein NM208_g10222 [Fusarium decemcellulare]